MEHNTWNCWCTIMKFNFICSPCGLWSFWVTHKTILVPFFSLSQQTVCQRRRTNRYLFFAHERESLWSTPPYRNQCNSYFSLSLSQSPVLSTSFFTLPSYACFQPVLTPLPLSPALIKAQWQIYTHSAAQNHDLLKVRGNNLKIRELPQAVSKGQTAWIIRLDFM